MQWMCLESLLSIPSYAFKNGLHLEDNSFFFSGAALRWIFTDLLERYEMRRVQCLLGFVLVVGKRAVI